jgi:hypothetical protein
VQAAKPLRPLRGSLVALKDTELVDRLRYQVRQMFDTFDLDGNGKLLLIRRST